MLGDLFSGPHIIIILAIVVLLFGATRLPALAKALGQSGRIFKSEMKASKDDDAATPAPDVAP
jgi:sec-independent protein translocase protein TatA